MTEWKENVCIVSNPVALFLPLLLVGTVKVVVVGAGSSCHNQGILEGALKGTLEVVVGHPEEQWLDVGTVQCIVAELQENQLLGDACPYTDPAKQTVRRMKKLTL